MLSKAAQHIRRRGESRNSRGKGRLGSIFKEVVQDMHFREGHLRKHLEYERKPRGNEEIKEKGEWEW